MSTIAYNKYVFESPEIVIRKLSIPIERGKKKV